MSDMFSFRNEIFRNTQAGILISHPKSEPVLVRNRVYDGQAAGIEIINGAAGRLEENRVFNNRFGGIFLATGSDATLINNQDGPNLDEIEEAIRNGECLYQTTSHKVTLSSFAMTFRCQHEWQGLHKAHLALM